MVDFDIEAIRAEVRALDFVRGTPEEVAEWHDADADSRANLVIEDMIPTPNEDAFFAMMLEEAVPPPFATQILLKLQSHPDADRALAIAPTGRQIGGEAAHWHVDHTKQVNTFS